MRKFINEKVLELLQASGVPVLTFSQVFFENPRMGMHLMSMDAAGCYDAMNDMIFIHDHALTSDLCTMTLLHELVHWTGHPSRLAREGISVGKPKTREQYATEEVTAQQGMFKLAMAFGFERELYERLLLGYIQEFAPYADFDKAERDSDAAVSYLLDMLAPAQGELFAA